jgi:type III secretory pathway component EscV
MHVHVSALMALSSFFSVLVLGTLWRLSAMHLSVAKSPLLNRIGQGMLIQY